MATANEQRVCIKFCVKLDKSATETIQLLQQAYGDSSLKKSQVFNWHRRFREGRESVEDDSRSGRPAEIRTSTNLERIKDLIMSDRRLTIRELSLATGFSYGTCQKVLTEDLLLRRVSAKFVPKLLSEEQKQQRVTLASDLKDSIDSNPGLIDKIITGDESWIYGYDPETRMQSSQWKHSGSPRPKKARKSRSQIKVMLIIFLDSTGIVHHEFLEPGTTVNQYVYLDVIKRLRESIRKKRPNLWQNQDWFLHHDNAPAHTALSVQQYCAKNGVTVIPHPPYSPDLAPCDFFLFPKLKSTMKGERFDDIDTLKRNTETELKAFTNNDFKNCIAQWKRRLNHCIEASGDYFEGDTH